MNGVIAVPVDLIWALIGAVFVHFLGFIYYAGKNSQLLADHDKRLDAGSETFQRHDDRIRALETRIPRSGEDRRAEA